MNNSLLSKINNNRKDFLKENIGIKRKLKENGGEEKVLMSKNITPEQSKAVANAYLFSKNYYNSQGFSDRVKTINDMNKENIISEDYVNREPGIISITDSPYLTSRYNNKTNNTYIGTGNGDNQSIESVAAHEFAHKFGYLPLTNNYEDYPTKIGNFYNKYLSPKQYDNQHDSTIAENYSNHHATREFLKQQGIYDAAQSGLKFTKEHYDKLKEAISRNIKDINNPVYKYFISRKSPQQLIDAMNIVAKNTNNHSTGSEFKDRIYKV